MASSGTESAPSQAGDIALASPAGWRTVSISEGVGFVGGHLKKPMFVPVERCGDDRFVLLSKGVDWLCHAAAVKARGLNPLSRTSLLRDIALAADKEVKKHSPQESAGSAGGMQGFGLDEEVAPMAQEKPAKKKKEKKAATVVQVELPARLRGGDPLRICCLVGAVAANRGVLVNLKHLSLVVETLAAEVQAGGVTFSPDDSPTEKPYFAARDRAWVARARQPGGTVLRKQLAIPMLAESHGGQKRPLTEYEYEDQKQRKLREIQEWQEEVRRGAMSRAGRGRPGAYLSQSD
jgi:hypothetical protein